MVDPEVKECKEKFQQMLQSIKPQDLIKDDTFLEKVQTYLTHKGIFSIFPLIIFVFRNILR
jgi:hypothetical protein